MAEHHELVAEMALLERMSTQDRLKLARKRRVQQLKKYNQREKEVASKKKKNSDTTSALATSAAAVKSTKRGKKCDYKVHFVPSVMLLESAARNDVEEVRRLLMLGVSPDSTNEDGLTALHQCCIDDSEEMMKLLIKFGANVNARDTEKWTPLHAAATCGHLHLAKYLIEKDADLLAVNSEGNMPYDICEDDETLDYIESEMAKRGITQEIIDETRAVTENQMLSDLKYLAETGQDLEYRDSSGATPLHIASANGYLSVVEFLLDHHVSTDVVDDDLWQPVHAAACWGHPDVLEALVQAGADLQARTKNGETPLDICEDTELKERIIQLKSEMETKRACTSHKLKRSHSSNTRSQSVRRTSIREKSQISRREAREEGRLRQEKGQVLTRATDEEDDLHANTSNGNEQCSSLRSNSSSVVVTSNTTANTTTTDSSSSPSSKEQQQLILHGHNTDNHVQPLDLKSIELYLADCKEQQPCMDPSVNDTAEGDRVDSCLLEEQHNQFQQLQQQQQQSSSVRSLGDLSPTYSVINKCANQDIALDSLLGGSKSQLSNGHSLVVNSNSGPGNGTTNTTTGNTNTTTSSGMEVKSRSADEPLPNNNNHLVSRQSSRESVKVEIHVTVNTSNPAFAAGTLADLKKLRSDQRKGSERTLNVIPCESSFDTLGGGSGSNNNLPCPPYLLDTQASPSACPPSPSNTLKRFRGDPSEVVGGGDSTKQGCCTIS